MVDLLAMHASDEALPAHLPGMEIHAMDVISIRVLTTYKDHPIYSSAPHYPNPTYLTFHLLTYLDGLLMTT
jgi:hypothetical protein